MRKTITSQCGAYVVSSTNDILVGYIDGEIHINKVPMGKFKKEEEGIAAVKDLAGFLSSTTVHLWKVGEPWY